MRDTPPRKAPSPDAPMGKIAPYGLRLPPELKEELDDKARANGRSLNSEIVARLQASLREGTGQIGAAVDQASELEALRAQMQVLEDRLPADLGERLARLEGLAEGGSPAKWPTGKSKGE